MQNILLHVCYIKLMHTIQKRVALRLPQNFALSRASNSSKLAACRCSLIRLCCSQFWRIWLQRFLCSASRAIFDIGSTSSNSLEVRVWLGNGSGHRSTRLGSGRGIERISSSSPFRYWSAICGLCSRLTGEGVRTCFGLTRGWFCIQARQIGYSGVVSSKRAKSTDRSNSFMMYDWCGMGMESEEEAAVVFDRFEWRVAWGSSESDSSSLWVMMSARAPLRRPRATATFWSERPSRTEFNIENTLKSGGDW